MKESKLLRIFFYEMKNIEKIFCLYVEILRNNFIYIYK